MNYTIVFLVEGKTEAEFVKSLPAAGFRLARKAHLRPIPLTTSSGKKGTFKGGAVNFKRVEKQLRELFSTHRGESFRFTTMFDFGDLKENQGFPGFHTKPSNDPYKQVEHLETSLLQELEDWRFIPYFQLYEFESLLFTDLDCLKILFGERAPFADRKFKQLAALKNDFKGNPEIINSNNSPSKRITAWWGGFKRQKVTVGGQLAMVIGEETLRGQCQHFDDWLTRLEQSVSPA